MTGFCVCRIVFALSANAERIVDLYQRHAGLWASARARENEFYERAWLDRFSALLSAGATILDLGCGTGKPMAMHLHGRGFLVTGIDSSPAMVAMFQARLPDQPAWVADMRTLSLGQRFGGILAWDSFFHLNHEDQRRMFTVFQAHAAQRGALMFTSGPAHGEALGELGGEPLYHASLDAAEYRQRLGDAGFAVVATLAQDSACGGRTVWLAQLG